MDELREDCVRELQLGRPQEIPHQPEGILEGQGLPDDNGLGVIGGCPVVAYLNWNCQIHRERLNNMPLFEPGETTLPVLEKSPVKDFPSQIAQDFNALMRGLDAGRDSTEQGASIKSSRGYHDRKRGGFACKTLQSFKN